MQIPTFTVIDRGGAIHPRVKENKRFARWGERQSRQLVVEDCKKFISPTPVVTLDADTVMLDRYVVCDLVTRLMVGDLAAVSAWRSTGKSDNPEHVCLACIAIRSDVMARLHLFERFPTIEEVPENGNCLCREFMFEIDKVAKELNFPEINGHYVQYLDTRQRVRCL